MSGQPSFIGMLTYGVRTLYWRPVHVAVLVLVASVVMYGFYTWSQSDAGIGFYMDFAEANLAMMLGDMTSYFSYMGQMLLVSLIVGSIFYAGAYRVMLRESPLVWLPFQLGADELRFIGLFVLMAALYLGITLAAGLIMGIIMLVLGFLVAMATSGSMGGSGSEAVLATLIGLAIVVPVMIVVFYILGRVSVSFPLSIKQRRFSLGGWSASRGIGWSLLLAHVVVYIAVLAVMMIFSWQSMMNYFAQSLDPQAIPEIDEMARQMANPYGSMMLIAVPIQTLTTFLLLGPTAAIAAAVDTPGAAEPASDENGRGENESEASPSD